MISACRKRGKCNEGMIAFWFNLSPNTAYMVFRQLRQLCREGMLDDEEFRCVDGKDEVMFESIVPKEVRKSEEVRKSAEDVEKEAREEVKKVMEAVPIE